MFIERKRHNDYLHGHMITTHYILNEKEQQYLKNALSKILCYRKIINLTKFPMDHRHVRFFF